MPNSKKLLTSCTLLLWLILGATSVAKAHSPIIGAEAKWLNLEGIYPIHTSPINSNSTNDAHTKAPWLLQRQSQTTDHIQTIASRNAKIAIIIDDLGYSLKGGKAALALPGAVTYAIIPHTPNAAFFAQQAQQLKKEVMLHAPMSTINHLPLGEHGLTEDMTEAELTAVLNNALDSLPSAVGLNNHMGSLLTQQQLPMQWVMNTLKKRQLYFIDSRTTSRSIALQVAREFDIPTLKRDVFLDHETTTDFIDQQFNRLVKIAKKQEYAIAIAHPHKETIRYLQKRLPKLAKEQVELVKASELVSAHSKK